MQVERIIAFLETKVLSFSFTSRGLEYLSLRARNGREQLDLSLLLVKNALSPEKELIIKETLNFLETGNHRMPLDFSDFTAFQQSVFSVVRAIKPGKILTYKEVAEHLGKPGAAQAVGAAITKNPVAYFLPTHRVLPKKGIGRCRTGAGHLREKLLVHEGHDLSQIRGNYICTRKKCCIKP